jgi:hypothetical protein
MAKRIYLSPIQNFGGEDGLMATVLRMPNGSQRPCKPGTVEQVISQNPDGSLAATWGMVFADFVDQAEALAVPGVYAMPEIDYDARVSTMSGATQTEMFNAFAARGIPLDIAPSERAYRRVVRALGNILAPGFDETVGGFAL